MKSLQGIKPKDQIIWVKGLYRYTGTVLHQEGMECVKVEFESPYNFDPYQKKNMLNEVVHRRQIVRVIKNVAEPKPEKPKETLYVLYKRDEPCEHFKSIEEARHFQARHDYYRGCPIVRFVKEDSHET